MLKEKIEHLVCDLHLIREAQIAEIEYKEELIGS